MPRSFVLRITPQVITMAARENSTKCMIAQAIRDIGGKYPVVTKESIAFNLDRTRYVYPLPARAAVELLKFDRGEEVRPFVLRLQGATATTREVVKHEPSATKRVPLLKGAKVKRSKRVHGPHRGFRRAEGLRMIEE